MIRTTVDAPWHGIDDATMRFLELHETLSHAMGGRTFRDLGDCIMLTSESEGDPFYNRVGAIRWPEGAGAFDRRVAEVIALFGSMDRRPNVWASVGFNTPSDLADRLVSLGFVAQEGGHVMVLVREPVRPRVAPRLAVERLDGATAVPPARVDEIAGLLVAAFGVDPERERAIAADTARAFESPAFHVALIREEGAAVAVGKRYTFDGASYLSSIGTRPEAWGRGYGSLLTTVLTTDALDGDSAFVHLGVHARNARAIDVYRRVGFEPVGGLAIDYLLI